VDRATWPESGAAIRAAVQTAPLALALALITALPLAAHGGVIPAPAEVHPGQRLVPR